MLSEDTKRRRASVALPGTQMVFWIGLYPGIPHSMIDYLAETFHQIPRAASAVHGA